jgi:hypothetical protein
MESVLDRLIDISRTYLLVGEKKRNKVCRCMVVFVDVVKNVIRSLDQEEEVQNI